MNTRFPFANFQFPLRQAQDIEISAFCKRLQLFLKGILKFSKKSSNRLWLKIKERNERGIMNLSLAHICIYTKDLAKTEEFYSKALGMTKVFNFIKNSKLFGFYLKMCDKNYIEVFEEKDIENCTSSIAHICLETDDINQMKKRLNDHGVKTSEIEKGADNTYQIWFKDPNGIDMELHQYTNKSAQITGGDVEVDW